ncbi:MAG: hypothetical protein JRH11_04505 [Deltaproteobacteria bacterium]|nr:hypothetical protein [Deltaproteobacteria bacterium]
MGWLRIALFLAGLVVFIHWAGGKRSARITFGTFWFLLSRPAIVVVSLIGIAGMAALLWNGAVENGKDPLASPELFIGISLISGVGFAALVVPPFWFLLCMRRAKPELVLAEGEAVIEKWPMNHFLGLESRGGHGYLTDRAIHFVPNRFVVQDGPWSLALEALAASEVEGGRLLVLRDTTGEEHLLVLQNPGDVAERLGF